MAIKPITPTEIENIHVIPDQIIEVANKLIIENWDGTSARFTVDELSNRSLLPENNKLNLTSEIIDAKKYLDIEETFITVGWNVKYIASDWHDLTPNYFIFTKA